MNLVLISSSWRLSLHFKYCLISKMDFLHQSLAAWFKTYSLMAFYRSKIIGYVLSFSVLIYFKIIAPFVKSISNGRINFYNKHLPSDPSYKNESINILSLKIIAFLWRRKTIIFIFRMPHLSSRPEKQQ